MPWQVWEKRENQDRLAHPDRLLRNDSNPNFRTVSLVDAALARVNLFQLQGAPNHMSWLGDVGKMADGKEYGSWSTCFARTMLVFALLLGIMILTAGGFLTYQLVADVIKGEDVAQEIAN